MVYQEQNGHYASAHGCKKAVDHEVKIAKDLLFETCANTTNPPVQKNGHTGSRKNEKHLMDIYALMGRVPTDKLPISHFHSSKSCKASSIRPSMF